MPNFAILALEDGRCFEGTSFGATGSVVGEMCFNTSMSGYQELLTDPSYRGQIVAMTYPQIGNYGINQEDSESFEPHVRGFVIGELCDAPSNWRSTEPLAKYLARHGVIGIEDVDTRSLTKHLRSRGAMRACVSTELEPAQAVERARNSPSIEGADLVRDVTTSKNYRWEDESRRWVLPNVVTGEEGPYADLAKPQQRIVAYDLGLKYNILRCLRQNGFEIEVVTATTTAAEVLAMAPDGVFLSNGPGDPAALGYLHREIRQLAEELPVFGICLGNQVLAHAFGGSTYKLKFGHRGGNHPVKDLRTGRVTITSQNHGFAVDEKSLPPELEVTHINLNDGTVAGLRHRDLPVFSVQYHPEAAPGPNDADYLFRQFSEMIERGADVQAR